MRYAWNMRMPLRREWEVAKVRKHETNLWKRRVIEAIHIKSMPHTSNLDCGLHLNPIWLPILHDNIISNCITNHILQLIIIYFHLHLLFVTTPSPLLLCTHLSSLFLSIIPQLISKVASDWSNQLKLVTWRGGVWVWYRVLYGRVWKQLRDSSSLNRLKSTQAHTPLSFQFFMPHPLSYYTHNHHAFFGLCFLF